MNTNNIIRIFTLASFIAAFVPANAKGLVAHDANKKVVKKDSIKKDKASFSLLSGDNKLSLKLKGNTENFYGKNSELFSGSKNDQIMYAKTTWDLGLAATLSDSISSKLVLRNKATWGNEEVIKTSSSKVAFGDAQAGSHKHYIGKLVPWIKEAWVDFSANKLFGVSEKWNQQVRIGAFSHKLGRGIAFGDAYAVSNGLLGFYSSSVVDQYAFGTRLSGKIFRDNLEHSQYFGFFENLSDKFDRVNSEVYASEIGNKETPQRGFGKINFAFASNLKWTAMDGSGDLGKLIVEPYLMFNYSPEQKIEFQGDASSKLATTGLNIDYVGDRFEWGVEYGHNFGTQKVKAWDRNVVAVAREKATGNLQSVYSRVYTTSAKTIKAPVTTTNKTAVEASTQAVTENGNQIGTSGLYNDANRFRAAYENKYRGFMLVADAAWCLKDKDLKIAGTFGWATGDEDPNVNLTDANDAQVDGDYQGFVGLHEIYSGKRVPSVFVIGSNDIVRPLSSPQNGFASSTSGFTNLIYIGTGVDWNTTAGNKEVNLKANVLSYWQDKATKKWDTTTSASSADFARKHLGFEINTSADIKLLDSLSGYVVGGVFIPGKHYDDIKGKPLNSVQLAALNTSSSTGYVDSGTPTIGTSTAFVLSWGLKLEF